MGKSKKSYGFVMGIAGAALLLLQTVLRAFGIELDVPYLSEVAAGVCSLLVMFGIITSVGKLGVKDGLAEGAVTENPADKLDFTAGADALGVDEDADLINILEEVGK